MTAPDTIHRSTHELGTLLAQTIQGRGLPVITQEQVLRQLLDLQAKFDRAVSCR